MHMHGNAQTAAQKNRAQLKAAVEIETNKTSSKSVCRKQSLNISHANTHQTGSPTEYCQKLRTTIIHRTLLKPMAGTRHHPGKEHIGSEPSYHSIQVKPVKPNTSSPSSPSNLSSRRRPEEGLTNLTDLMEVMLLMGPKAASGGLGHLWAIPRIDLVIRGPAPQLIWPCVGQPCTCSNPS